MTDSEKLDLLLQKSTVLESEVGTLKVDVKEMKESQASLRQDMEEMKTSLRQDIKEMKTDISSLRKEFHLTIDNEIVPDISVIAEGHLDLSRKLNECIHLTSDIKAQHEILEVYINMQKQENRLKALG